MNRQRILPVVLVILATLLPYTAGVVCTVFDPEMIAMDDGARHDGAVFQSERTADGCDYPSCAVTTVATVAALAEVPVANVHLDGSYDRPADRNVFAPQTPPTPPPIS